jgi:DNA invertase Pin-like site-specific DNA recombinase
VTGLKIGYARVSADAQDLTAQRDAPAALGVGSDRLYVDHGLTCTNRDRPGLRQALAACRAGDTLVVRKLDRLARSLPDARAIADELTDPADPIGRLLFNVLAMVAEFEADLARMRTREGMKVARAKGRLQGKQPKPSSRQEAHLAALHGAGEHTVGELEELYGVTRSTVCTGRSPAAGPAQPRDRGGQRLPANATPVRPLRGDPAWLEQRQRQHRRRTRSLRCSRWPTTTSRTGVRVRVTGSRACCCSSTAWRCSCRTTCATGRCSPIPLSPSRSPTRGCCTG